MVRQSIIRIIPDFGEERAAYGAGKQKHEIERGKQQHPLAADLFCLGLF